MTNLSGPGALRIERRLEAPVDGVWVHLVDPELRSTWLAGGELEPRLGGKVALVFRHDDLTGADDPAPEAYGSAPARGHVAHGVVTVWEPTRRLAHTWEAGTEASEVAFALTEADGGARLTVVHRRLDTRATVVTVAAGWDAHLALLAAVLAGAPRPPYWRAFAASEAHHRAAFAGRAEADGRPQGFAALRALADGGFRLEYDRVVAASVGQVWRALAEPERRDRWYPAELRFEGPVGGWARERFPDQPEPASTGRLTAWEEERRLAFAFDADPTSDEPSVHHAQTIDIELVADGAGTRLAFAYAFGDRAFAPAVGAGWHRCLDALAAVAQGDDGGSEADPAEVRRRYGAWLAAPFDGVEASDA